MCPVAPKMSHTRGAGGWRELGGTVDAGRCMPEVVVGGERRVVDSCVLSSMPSATARQLVVT